MIGLRALEHVGLARLRSRDSTFRSLRYRPLEFGRVDP